MSTDSTQAEAIAAAVEAALTTGDTAAQKQDKARNVYLVWRNANLGGLAPAAFAQVEASSGALISAIADIL